MENIKIEIVGKSYDKLHEIANMPHELNDILSSPRNNNLSLLGMRFLLILVANLKERQIAKKDREQLNLFDNEMFNIDNELNYSTALSFHYSDFLPKGNKNYIQVRTGLQELRELKTSIKVDLNKGLSDKPTRVVNINSALIMSSIEEENRGFKIIMDIYWYRLFINMTDGYNPYIKSLAFNANSIYTIQFYFYLKKLKKIEKTKQRDYKELYEKLGDAAIEVKGTITFVENFIETLRIPYKYESQIIRDYLEPTRAELNQISDISFNYKFENNKIYIITYPGNKALIEQSISKAETVKIRSAINYKVLKYDLNQNESLLLVELYIKYGYQLVTKATNKNKALKGLAKGEYFSIFNLLIDKYFKNSGLKLDVVGYSERDKNAIREELFRKFGNFNSKDKINNQELEEKYSHLKNRSKK